MPSKTRDVCKATNCGYWWLVGKLRSGKLPAPAKDSSGDFVWGPEDVERVRRLMATARKGEPAVQGD